MRLWLFALLSSFVVVGCGRIGFDVGAPVDSGGADVAIDSSPGDGATDSTVTDAVTDAPTVDSAVDGGLDPDLVVWLPLDGDPGVGTEDLAGRLTNPTCDPSRCPSLVPGVIGNGYEYDGLNDYVRFDSSPELDFGSTGQPFSVSVWYQTFYRGPLQQVVYAQATDAGDVSFQLSFEDLSSGGTYDVVWKVCEVACTSESFAQDVDGVEVVVWRFAVGVWTGAESILYIDGVERARAATAGVKYDGMPFMLGADWERGGSIENSFDGVIDDLRIYRRVLSVAEQMEMMRDAMGGSA